MPSTDTQRPSPAPPCLPWRPRARALRRDAWLLRALVPITGSLLAAHVLAWIYLGAQLGFPAWADDAGPLTATGQPTLHAACATWNPRDATFDIALALLALALVLRSLLPRARPAPPALAPAYRSAAPPQGAPESLERAARRRATAVGLGLAAGCGAALTGLLHMFSAGFHSCRTHPREFIVSAAASVIALVAAAARAPRIARDLRPQPGTGVRVAGAADVPAPARGTPPGADPLAVVEAHSVSADAREKAALL